MVAKRKRYAGGGLVDAATRLGSQVQQGRQDQADWRGYTQASIDRGKAGDIPGQATESQRSDIVSDRMAARHGYATKYPASQPEGYPAPTYTTGAAMPGGYRKGGMVMKKPVKGYQRGGFIREDTAPGAASASSHRWSANIAGRDVSMKNKGGKVTKTTKGKK